MGKNSVTIAYKISKCIPKIVDDPKAWTICIIPASTAEKTKVRFMTFCANLSSFLQMENGYEFICNLKDRAPGHIEGHMEDPLINLAFKKEFNGKRIILFDDVITRGKNFRTVADKLLELGAKKVIGLMLGPNIYKDDDIITQGRVEVDLPF